MFVAAIATAIAEGGSPETCYRAALEGAERSAADETVVQALKDAESQAPPTFNGTRDGW